MVPTKIALLTDSSAESALGGSKGKTISFLCLCGFCVRTESIWTAWTFAGRTFTGGCGAGSCPRPRCRGWRISAPSSMKSLIWGMTGVIAVMLSSGLSGTYNLARIVAEECREQGRAMVAFDSLSGSLGLGMTVLQLAEDIRNGMGWEELTERRVPQLIQNTYPFFTLDTLEYLQKGGRIGKVTALAGTMLPDQAGADLCR